MAISLTLLLPLLPLGQIPSSCNNIDGYYSPLVFERGFPINGVHWFIEIPSCLKEEEDPLLIHSASKEEVPLLLDREWPFFDGRFLQFKTNDLLEPNSGYSIRYENIESETGRAYAFSSDATQYEKPPIRPEILSSSKFRSGDTLDSYSIGLQRDGEFGITIIEDMSGRILGVSKNSQGLVSIESGRCHEIRAFSINIVGEESMRSEPHTLCGSCSCISLRSRQQVIPQVCVCLLLLVVVMFSRASKAISSRQEYRNSKRKQQFARGLFPDLFI